MLCNALKVSRSAFYDWLARPAQIITEQELNLYRTAKRLFKRSRGSLGSRQLAKKLREEGFTIGRYRTRTIMRKLGLVVRQRRACLDNAVVERFFGSLKNEWLLNVVYLTRDAMKEDVEEYIRYYNHERLHTTLGDLTPIDYEKLQSQVSYWA